ncbi:beta-lactamase family protein [Chitinophaga sedimenti]|uniref:serine hydrolase domain-containing protein n=1 Tax=Chitinophaga sedimenti TaxID=2033606 RepID=UPI00200360AA|nr:serine hydrolase domain-containing protein [Chitinophaga sedimenti]MCK7559955.1 beta-lactamase family protein [Chitinophaga sedimenti]
MLVPPLSRLVTSARRLLLKRVILRYENTFPCFVIRGHHAIKSPELLPPAYFDSVARYQLYPGNLAMAMNSKMVYQFSGGFADYRLQKRNHPQTRFNLASISKIFTSTAILQLRDKGKLQLDDAVQKYLPEFPFQGVSIRHLLTHTSGLPNLELTDAAIRLNPDTVITNAILLPLLQQWNKPLYFKPGEEFRYCNTGYMLAAMIVEKITRQPFARYLEQHIFRPAGMQNTYLAIYGSSNWNDTARAVHQVLPVMYNEDYIPASEVKRFRYSEYNNQAAYGSSNIISTTADMLLFDAAFFGGRLLRKSSMEEALTPIKLNNGKVHTEHMDTMLGEGEGHYGMGWEIFEQPGFGKSVGHGGFKFGMATFYFHHLQPSQTIVAFINGESRFGDIVTSAFYLLNGRATMPLEHKRSAVRAYARALQQGDANHAAAVLQAARADTANYFFNYREMNRLGYDFLYFASFKDHQQLSLETFKLNTFIAPDDFNTYDSYGEALRESGRRDDAISMYRRSWN